jgi:ABC-type multidrug transport system fused ATPase/permease subunit
MYYLSVFGYALKGLALNEFNADVYRHPVPVNSTAFLQWSAANGNSTDQAAACSSGTVPCLPLGDVYLGYLDLTTNLQWMWGSLGFIAGFAVIMTVLSGLVLKCVKIERNVGSSRLSDDDDAATATAAGDAAAVTVPGTPLVADGSSAGTPSKKSITVATTAIPVDVEAAGGVVPTQTNPMGRPASPSTKNVAAAAAAAAPVAAAAAADGASSASSVLPFEPMTVAWRDVTYEVTLPKQLGGGKKTLLHGISGYAEPGKMIALMGASGAGKTTLLDVLAGRKNSGRMTGAISLNGHPKEDRSFARLTAYCEQQDIHNVSVGMEGGREGVGCVLPGRQ